MQAWFNVLNSTFCQSTYCRLRRNGALCITFSTRLNWRTCLQIGIAEQNVSLLKSGKAKGVRFDTLEKICEALDCQPGDILEYRPEDTP
jgi:hypothetical protein